MLKALNWHEDCREEFFPSDPSYFTDELKNSEAAKHEYKDMEDQMNAMHQELNKSIPFFSTRYQVKKRSLTVNQMGYKSLNHVFQSIRLRSKC